LWGKKQDRPEERGEGEESSPTKIWDLEFVPEIALSNNRKTIWRMDQACGGRKKRVRGKMGEHNEKRSNDRCIS